MATQTSRPLVSIRYPEISIVGFLVVVAALAFMAMVSTTSSSLAALAAAVSMFTASGAILLAINGWAERGIAAHTEACERDVRAATKGLPPVLLERCPLCRELVLASTLSSEGTCAAGCPRRVA